MQCCWRGLILGPLNQVPSGRRYQSRASVLGADRSLSIKPVEQVGKIVSVIKIEVDLGYIVHQRWPVRDSINNCPQVATWQFFHRIAHRRIKPSKSNVGKLW